MKIILAKASRVALDKSAEVSRAEIQRDMQDLDGGAFERFIGCPA
jgi:hypothetical protein